MYLYQVLVRFEANIFVINRLSGHCVHVFPELLKRQLEVRELEILLFQVLQTYQQRDLNLR